MDDVLPTLAASLDKLPLLTTLAAGFLAAWVFGLITQRLGLSPIVGYLLAGVAIGPHTPGFIGDVGLAQQIAEVGVILLMFGVGLHFKPRDLVAVRGLALPGAIGQSVLATFAAAAIFHALGWSMTSGIVLGMAMSVASTVVLLRVLMDRNMVNTGEGHVAIGWLIVEDVFTVIALVLVPIVAVHSGMRAASEAEVAAGGSALVLVGWAILKLLALVLLVALAGSRIVPWILARVALLRSRELFTLTVLVLSVTIAVGAAAIFGASVALGAFLAGMVVAQSPASHQAAADALPMRDAFAVLFFVSVGMLFDPSFLIDEPLMVLAGLFVVLAVKPFAALLICAICGASIRTGLTVAIGLAQIGEFSFILAQVAREQGIMPPEGMNVLVATAMISITLNPLIFGTLAPIERFIERTPALKTLLGGRHARKAATLNAAAPTSEGEKPLAVIVGYGPVGRVVDALLRDAGMDTVVVDWNLHTVSALAKQGRTAIYGDATRREVLEYARIDRAAHLVITLPHTEGRTDLVLLAREMNPAIEITVRARYLAEHDALTTAGSDRIIYEEGEAGIALARHVLESRGLERGKLESLLKAIRTLWRMDEGRAEH